MICVTYIATVSIPVGSSFYGVQKISIIKSPRYAKGDFI